MKKKDRTVEVFSLSALYLFAVAMGEFVMLSVIMLPYDYKGKELEAENGTSNKHYNSRQPRPRKRNGSAKKRRTSLN